MKKIIFLFFLISFSCSHEIGNEMDLEFDSSEKSSKVPDWVYEKIEELSFSSEGLYIQEFESPDGNPVQKLIVEGDIMMDLDYLRDLKIPTKQASKNSNAGKLDTDSQYRMTEVVNYRFRITVVGNDSGSSALNANQRTALTQAVAAYNDLNLNNLKLSLRFGSSATSSEVMVSRLSTINGVGGMADPPRSGVRPGSNVFLFTGLDNQSLNVNRHVIMHELGHSFGMRHTDFFSREGCSNPGNEGQGDVGAVHIAGTPATNGWDRQSVFRACFALNVPGQFSATDITALDVVYDTAPFPPMWAGN